MRRILFCPKDATFTLKEACPTCGAPTTTTQPPKFSVEDKYASYRREGKKKQRSDAGLL
jgi:H/ACA ribonucleoprotein complex subunit 3